MNVQGYTVAKQSGALIVEAHEDLRFGSVVFSLYLSSKDLGLCPEPYSPESLNPKP
jgi:hypothetical protein